MRKYAVIAALAIPVFSSSSYASETAGVYIGVKASYARLEANDPKLSYLSNQWQFADRDDKAFGGGLAVGYDFDKKFSFPARLELEYIWRDDAEFLWQGNEGIFIAGNFDWALPAKADVSTLMVNAYYDIKNKTPFTPYLSAGIGTAFIEWESHYSDSIGTTPISATGDSNELAWSVGIGCSYSINENFTADLGYRYMDAGTASATYLAIKAESEIKLHEVVMTLRYTF